LSPDQRFLSETLLDTTVSPAGERQRVARETQAALLSGDSPTQGPDGAPITLVEFSDFQCPYCERFTELVRRLQPEDRQRFTLVFKHRPLPMHQWARRAALASICVSFQSTESFWRLEDFLFASQHALTSENLEDQIGAYAKESGVIDVGRMHTCLLEGKAEEILRRDEGLADVYHVDAVPTVFVNGVRAVGYRSVQEFQAALNAAFARASPVKAREGRGDRAVGSH
jgi:protein-disulfide isomerase